MDIPTSLLVQTLTAATLSYPSAHVDNCVGALGFTLGHAGFSNVEVSENPQFGVALECDRDAQHHIVLVLILSPELYETTDDAIQELAHTLIESDDHLDDLARALDGALLDIASVCFDPVNGRCRIHHPQDLLETGAVHDNPVHFFIPAGADVPIPANECPENLRMAPYALASVIGA